MHGRVKVKTDAQKEAEKAAKREKISKYFTHARNKIFELKRKFEKEEISPDELLVALKITEEICSQNADWAVVWRFRVLVFQKLITIEEEDSKRQEKNEVEKSAENVDNIDPETIGLEISTKEDNVTQKLIRDLNLTYQILLQNPKSYSTWQHRRVILDLLKHVDSSEGQKYVEREIQLTEQLLMSRTETQVENQGRNFHCWDHRRLLLRTNPTFFDLKIEEELTTKLITTSFSNFSAWHYRSKLLNLAETKIAVREFELVLNAVFTDPADSSSWIYHRYLIAKSPTNSELSDVLNSHFESLEELEELEKEEDSNVSVLRSISLSKLAILKKLKFENWKVKSVQILNDLAKIDQIRVGYYNSQIQQIEN